MQGEAELRWLENGKARLLAGATGRHPTDVAGMRSPRGAACLTRSDAYARVGGERRQRARWAGPTSAGGPEVRRRPVKGEKPFFKFYFQEIFNISFQIPF